MTASFDLNALEMGEVFFYHDVPRLYVTRHRSGQRYLVSDVEEDGSTETYLYLPVSKERLDLIKGGGIFLRDAYLESESGEVLVVEVDYQWTNPSATARAMTSADVPDKWLAAPNHTLLK